MDNYRSLAVTLLDALNPNLSAAGARIDIVADALEALVEGVRVNAVGIAPTDRVTGERLLAWDCIRDLRTRLERVEDVAGRLSPGEERLARLGRDITDHRLEHTTDGYSAGEYDALTAERLLRDIVNAAAEGLNDTPFKRQLPILYAAINEARLWLTRTTEGRVLGMAPPPTDTNTLELGTRVTYGARSDGTAGRTGVITARIDDEYLITDDDPNFVIQTVSADFVYPISEDTDQ
jgi:hypothetical protein